MRCQRVLERQALILNHILKRAARSCKHSMISCSSHLYYAEYLCLPRTDLWICVGVRTGVADDVIPRPDDLTLLSNSFVFFCFIRVSYVSSLWQELLKNSCPCSQWIQSLSLQQLNCIKIQVCSAGWGLLWLEELLTGRFFPIVKSCQWRRSTWYDILSTNSGQINPRKWIQSTNDISLSIFSPVAYISSSCVKKLCNFLICFNRKEPIPNLVFYLQ